MKHLIQYSMAATLSLATLACFAQGTLTLTFDGTWSGSEYKSYELSGVTVSAIYDSISFANGPDGNGYLAGWYNGRTGDWLLSLGHFDGDIDELRISKGIR
jgi:hypothetical protein